jgi:ABC-type sugar transport system ATPase subunit
VLLVSTDVGELAELPDRVVVFDRGSLVGELSGESLTPGRTLAPMTRRPPSDDVEPERDHDQGGSR